MAREFHKGDTDPGIWKGVGPANTKVLKSVSQRLADGSNYMIRKI